MSLQSIIDDMDTLESQLDDEAQDNGAQHYALMDALKALRFSQSIIQRVIDLDDGGPEEYAEMRRDDYRQRAREVIL